MKDFFILLDSLLERIRAADHHGVPAGHSSSGVRLMNGAYFDQSQCQSPSPKAVAAGHLHRLAGPDLRLALDQIQASFDAVMVKLDGIEARVDALPCKPAR